MDTGAENKSRFVWKRNIKYDITLLSEVIPKNPFGFNNQKPAWEEVAKALRESSLKMKVTDRSCRERVNELLKNHRKKELSSIRASGISENEMSELNRLLISVASLEETKPDKQLKSLYSSHDKGEAEAIRSKALQQVECSDDENPLFFGETVQEEMEMGEFEEKLIEEEKRKRKLEKSKDPDKNKNKKVEIDEDFEFGPKQGRYEKPTKSNNPKNELVNYLENKNEKEMMLRKDELRLRKQEIDIKAKENENKSKELELLHMKAQSEIEERKMFQEFMMKMAKPKD